MTARILPAPQPSAPGQSDGQVQYRCAEQRHERRHEFRMSMKTLGNQVAGADVQEEPCKQRQRHAEFTGRKPEQKSRRDAKARCQRVGP